MTKDETEYKVRENRARRQLHRQGFTLMKNRSRNPQTWNNGYMITNTKMAEAGYTGNGFTMDLDEVETFVKE